MNQIHLGTRASKSPADAVEATIDGSSRGAPPVKLAPREFPRVTAYDLAKLKRHWRRLEEERPGDSDARATLF